MISKLPSVQLLLFKEYDSRSRQRQFPNHGSDFNWKLIKARKTLFIRFEASLSVVIILEAWPFRSVPLIQGRRHHRVAEKDRAWTPPEFGDYEEFQENVHVLTRNRTKLAVNQILRSRVHQPRCAT